MLKYPFSQGLFSLVAFCLLLILSITLPIQFFSNHYYYIVFKISKLNFSKVSIPQYIICNIYLFFFYNYIYFSVNIFLLSCETDWSVSLECIKNSKIYIDIRHVNVFYTSSWCVCILMIIGFNADKRFSIDVLYLSIDYWTTYFKYNERRSLYIGTNVIVITLHIMLLNPCIYRLKNIIFNWIEHGYCISKIFPIDHFKTHSDK